MEEEIGLDAPPSTVTDWLERYDELFDTLPKRLKQCASYTRRHLHLIAVSTVSELAQACDVAPSVYMRFCQALGYSGYSEMQAVFRAKFTDFRPDYSDRIARLNADGSVSSAWLLGEFAESGHKSLISLANTATNEVVDRVAHGMAGSRIVHLVGLRRAYAVVSNMAYLFSKLGVSHNLHSGAGMLDLGGAIARDDVLFAVTFAPFSDETVAIAEATYNAGAKVYGLSDSNRCPLSAFATEMLIAREDEVAGFRTLTAPLTLSTALAVAVGSIARSG